MDRSSTLIPAVLKKVAVIIKKSFGSAASSITYTVQTFDEI